MTKQRRPVRNLKELAVEFGISVNTLRGIIAVDETFPKAILTKGQQVESSFGKSKFKLRYGYYDYADMQAWWKKRQELKGEK